ncbi:MAG TPA: ketoacyl-ACP synthase III [Candidatus Latescibacteria bacterium]|jgi:3-oxoacyl-[acyl-carrier-protein] synthase-3|nr:3-oxoacyl-ACP synthase [Gemmatimonadaceae bacterium]MDP6015331.1 ketoacyl-ACP synthase III [Candidatus Latescibacterota bacterium]HJP31998.1 ketoacyl-ACP synthase III [Candidatus Latescibacterota bacterium]
MGHYHPGNIIDNTFLEALDIGTNDEWILERVGIHSRRTVLPLDYIRETKNQDPRQGQEAAEVDSRQTAAVAADMALERAGISRDEIGMVIAGGCYPDMAIPCEASRIAGSMGIAAPGIDINSACSTFGAQLHFLGSMSGLPPYILVINPENTTPAIDYSDRRTAVLWGDGTSAAVVSVSEPSRLRVRDTSIAADSARWEAVCIPRFGHFHQDGNAVQRFAIKTTLSCARALESGTRERLAERRGRLHFIGHQANLAMLQSVASRLGLKDSEHWYNVADYGNTGAAGAPCVLSQHWDELADGDSVIMVVVGSGLTWSSLCIDVG